MRISDWSSDVCSSDLPSGVRQVAARLLPARHIAGPDAGRGAGSVDGRLGRRIAGRRQAAARASLSRAPSFRVHARAGRRRAEGAAGRGQPCPSGGDRKSVVWGKSVSVRVDLGGGRIITKKTNQKSKTQIEMRT